MTEYIDTIFLSLFGTSMPIVPLPGIGAMIRIPRADKLSAMSSSRFLILEMRTPGDGTISYCKNNTITENVYIYYNKYQWVRDNTKANTFSTDFLKLKEVRLDYRFPERWMQKTKFLRSASIGVFATNLFCITNWPQYDPEAAGVVSGTNIYGGIETGSFPMTRTYGFNIKLQF